MSKAFTREDDDAPESVAPWRTWSSLPPGATNYLTADGAARYRAELAVLTEKRGGMEKEMWPLSAQRIAELQGILMSAEVVEANSAATDQVTFGATVTLREEDGKEVTYRIVGVDEADGDRGWVSWLSPLARALVMARLGQRVVFQSPAGERKLEVVAIDPSPPR